MGTLNRIYRTYGKKAHILVVYIREAHASDGWKSRANERAGINIKTHKTLADRLAAAQTCAAELKFEMPVALDGMDNKADKAYAGMPDRLAVVAKGGTLVYYGERGPRGFKPAEAEAALKRQLDKLAKAQQVESALDDALK